MLKKPVDKKIAVVALALMVGISSLFIYQSQKTPEDFAILGSGTPEKNLFGKIPLQAKAVYVYDVKANKVLFEKNADQPLPLASVTKIMTAVVAKENIPSIATITIDANSLESEGDSGLKEGERWSLKNLLSYMLVVSSNDGAQSLANTFMALTGRGQEEGDNTPDFVTMMNRKAKTLGLSSMTFSNPTGLDIASTSTETGGIGSAKDVAELIKYTIAKHPELMESTKYSTTTVQSENLSHIASNTDIAVNDIPNVIASKTGYTAIAGGNLAVAFDKGLNEPVIVVVLGSTYDGRFTDAVNLAGAAIQTYNIAQ